MVWWGDDGTSRVSTSSVVGPVGIRFIEVVRPAHLYGPQRGRASRAVQPVLSIGCAHAACAETADVAGGRGDEGAARRPARGWLRAAVGHVGGQR